jgi:hypothetical protein
LKLAWDLGSEIWNLGGTCCGIIRRVMAAHTGIEPTFDTSQIRVISAEGCGNQRVNRTRRKSPLCIIAQNYAASVSEFVRKLWQVCTLFKASLANSLA